jgi:SAM-dependent methyltransferase
LNSKPYSTRFTNKIAAEEYEKNVYSPESYSSDIWQLQIPVLLKIIRTFKLSRGPIKLLDFACGTGRILSLVENEVFQSDGIDVSAFMTDLARAKCEKSNFFVGNLIEQPDMLSKDYDVITCFRFLLNTEAANRIAVLKVLRERLAAKNGILIVNIHGHSRSFRSLALLYRRLVHNEQHVQMSRKEIKSLFYDSGLRIVEEYGFGILPPLLYKTPLRKPAKWIDNFCHKFSFLRMFSIDLLYVCKLDEAELSKAIP